MASFSVRLERLILSLLVFIFVSLAVLVTALRIALPRLDNYQQEIESWINQGSGLNFTIGEVHGYWKNTHPSLSLSGLQADIPKGVKAFSVGEVRAEFDLVDSLLSLQPKVSELVVDGLHIDISDIDLFHRNDEGQQPKKEDDQKLLHNLENLILRQLSEFSLTNSSLVFKSADGGIREVEIENLNWHNNENRHRADGVISIKDVQLNSVSVIADFTDNNGLADISGDFYLQGNNFNITPWVSPYLADGVVVDKGRVSLNTWVSLKNNTPIDAYLEISPSQLQWRDKHNVKSSISINGGVMKLDPTEEGWQLNGQDLAISSNGQKWPDLNIAFQWSPEQWKLNATEIKLDRLTPILDLLPDMEKTKNWVNTVKLDGRVKDIRVSMGKGVESLRYSAKVEDGRMEHWELLPGFHTLEAQVFGRSDLAKARVTMIDDTLPYGDVFQAPLSIRQAELDLVWQSDDDGWRLWSDKVTAATPDLQVLGAFKLDFPKQSPAFLSFYAEADLLNAGQTWRYLPTLALGRGLTDYLSSGIQGGTVKTAKLLWYGELSKFPYRNNDGVFQAWVPLRKTKFSFSTEWPALTDMQLDLLFENETMFLDSRDAKLLNIHADRISGQIPQMHGDGHIEIFAAAKAEGSDVRDYMSATPLVGSVGAVLTTIDIKGQVDSQFQLHIPFSTKEEPRAWGYADLNNNDINITAPPMKLTKASGRIEFDNDVVKSSGLKAGLLGQPIALDFTGQNAESSYDTRIDLIGDWSTKPLIPYLGKTWLEPISGHAPWNMGIDLQINDVGFTYQIDAKANLTSLASNYPEPMKKKKGEVWQARMQASGNQESISARLQLPVAKFQTEIDITQGRPVLKATNTVIGSGSFRVSPIVGHHASLRLPKFDVDEWRETLGKSAVGPKPIVSELNAPEFPTPQRIRVQTDSLTIGGLDWNDVDLIARNRNNKWDLNIDSSQIKGKADYDGQHLNVALSQLQLYLADPESLVDESVVDQNDLKNQEKPKPLISDFDRSFFANIPSFDLKIDDFWMQGYKVGKVDVVMKHDGQRLVWDKANLTSGKSSVTASGWWKLTDKDSVTHVDINAKGDNNSEIMARFGINSGIQKAPFEFDSSLDWKGSPWNIQVDTLNGTLDADFGRGVISDVGGAAKLLGMFSLDSLVRRMQLDFSDVFDDGLAFDSIEGSGKVENGIFVTNNLKMDSISGDMTIRGLANLNTQMVDAEVTFKPDVTSGIPMLTAFAVAPQTALYVLAISTVVAPVIEIITQVTYEIKGPMNAPTVKEKSRRKGDYEVPKKLRSES
ncbi:TIGR02099 family protein [Vibrio sp. UCD-FRSSP16_10]|uniref:YhdP family protein n=1 Tax=unclassified Vibrio TaxID=2614977 RepID=UPI000801D1DF|nr:MULTISPECIES: YhdP family protein [unclassified Vibrio]OBT17431.1 TIGR02099 family protein [Vibrio sp. UCD-FRSSP16_30]OBT23200.1 TIGR02099 family protein [Vibrio sp. UCD-FRSSP16_10]